MKGGIQTSAKNPKPARKVVSDDVQPRDLTLEQSQECTELMSCPAGEIVAVPAIRGAFGRENSPLQIDDGAAADDPVWVLFDREIVIAGSVILRLLEHAASSQLSEADAAIAMSWIERLGWAIPNPDASPQQRLLVWIGENDAKMALDWLLVGRAKSCCEMLSRVRRLREAGFGQQPIIGAQWLVDADRPGSRASDTSDWYRAAFESICRDFQNLEILLDHAFRWLRIPRLPPENFHFDDTAADIDKRGGAAAEMKKWTSAVCSESEAWRWIYDRVKSYFAVQLAAIDVALAWYIVRLQEVPHGWESARERHYPDFPIKTADDLRSYAKSAHQQIAASRSSNLVRPLVILPDVQMVLRNVRHWLREWATPEPDGFTDIPTDIHEAERQLELVARCFPKRVTASLSTFSCQTEPHSVAKKKSESAPRRPSDSAKASAAQVPNEVKVMATPKEQSSEVVEPILSDGSDATLKPDRIGQAIAAKYKRADAVQHFFRRNTQYFKIRSDGTRVQIKGPPRLSPKEIVRSDLERVLSGFGDELCEARRAVYMNAELVKTIEGYHQSLAAAISNAGEFILLYPFSEKNGARACHAATLVLLNSDNAKPYEDCEKWFSSTGTVRAFGLKFRTFAAAAWHFATVVADFVREVDGALRDRPFSSDVNLNESREDILAAFRPFVENLWVAIINEKWGQLPYPRRLPTALSCGATATVEPKFGQVKETLEPPMGKAADESPAAETATKAKHPNEVKPPDAVAGWPTLSPDDLRKLFDIKQDALLRRLKSQTIPNLCITTKAYRVDPTSLPDDWKRTLRRS